MPKVRFGDVVREVKHNIDRNNNPYESYVAGDHMDTADLTIHRRGCFATDDVGPAFVREFKKGQVLYGSRRTYLKKVAVADFDGVTANTTFVLETKNPDIFLQTLLPFVMLTDSFTEWSVKRSKGSTNPYVLFSDLADFEFELPDIEEQRRVSDVLWACFRLREHYEGLIQQCDALVQSQFVEMFNPVVSMQNEWAKYSLSEMADVGSSKRVFVDELKPEGVPFFRGTEVGALAEGETITPELFITEEHYETLKALSGAVTKGDLLLPSICPDGRIWQVNTDKPFYFKDGRVLWIHPKQQVINSTYLLYCLKTIFAEKYDEIASGTTFAELKIFSLKALQISLPPLELQQRFEFLVQNTDKSKLAIRQALESLEKSRSAIMTKVFG